MMDSRQKTCHYKSGALPTELSRLDPQRPAFPPNPPMRGQGGRQGQAEQSGKVRHTWAHWCHNRWHRQNGLMRDSRLAPALTTNPVLEASMADAFPKKILPFLEGKIGALRMMRFWSKVDVRGPDECWEWQAHINTSGYGRFKIASYQTATASRVALIGNSKQEPDGLHVLHTCDNRKCCNPHHLYFGTVAQNNQDKVDRGRATTGDQSCASNGGAKLTEDQVVQIVDRFRRGMNNKQIARDLPVTHQMVSKIRRGHMWRPVTERLGWTPAQPYKSGEAA